MICRTWTSDKKKRKAKTHRSGPRDTVAGPRDAVARQRDAIANGIPAVSETPEPFPETPPQSEGMMTRAQAKGGGGLRHVPGARATRQLGHLARPPPPARESTERAGQEHQGLPPARESTGQDQEQQGLEDDDELMLRRGLLQPHAKYDDGQDGPTDEKRVYNRGELREHDAKWEEPLLKQIKHLKEMTMRAEAARAGKRFKHAVTALSVMSYETGQKNLYRTLAAMTDGQLLSALAEGSIELSINGATPPARQPTSPRPQPANMPTPRRDLPSQPTQRVAPPSQPKREASPLQQQQQASPLDRQQGWGRQERASQGQQSEDSRAQLGSSGQNQPRGDQPPADAPQAQLPTDQPEQTANQKKTHQSIKKALKRYWARKFRKGE
jgi:hypothetical protein